MTGARGSGSGAVELDTGVPHIARVCNYWLGGKDHYAADREAAEEVIATAPRVAPTTARWGGNGKPTCGFS